MKKRVNRREFIGQMALGAAGILASGCAASSALTLKDTATPMPTPKPVAQASPTPSPMLAELGDVQLESGQVLKDTRVGYMTKGTLNADASNAVVVFTALTRTSPLIMGREGKWVDDSKYHIIVVDALGNGVSSSPSNSKQQPGAQFPAFAVRDIVNIHHRFLTEVLKLPKVYAVLGDSFGGIQAFQWAASYPDYMRKAISVQGTPRSTAWDWLVWKPLVDLVTMSRTLPNDGRALVQSALAGVFATIGYSPGYHLHNTKSEQAPQVFAAMQQFANSFDWENFVSQARALAEHDIYKEFGGSAEAAAEKIKTDMLVIVAATDHLVQPEPSQELAKLLNAKLITITNDTGHLGLLAKEGETIQQAVRSFLG